MRWIWATLHMQSLIGLLPVQAENDALQSLVLEVAANKAEARAKVARLKEKYNHLLRKARSSLSRTLRAFPFIACMELA